MYDTDVETRDSNKPRCWTGWYAVNTKRRQEDSAELHLQRLGVETFYPRLKQNKVIRRRRQTVIAPLFPGYLFARFNPDTHYRAVNYASGVQKVVTYGDTPATVDEETINAIKSKLLDGYIRVQPPLYRSGQRIRIQKGPLQGFDALFEKELSGHQRAVLLLRALSYQARVVLDLEALVDS